MVKEKNQIKIASILSYIQIFLSVIIGLLYSPLLIRTLGKSEYGLYNTVISIISIISTLSLGFNSGYIQYYIKYKKNEDYNSIYRLNGLYLIVFLIIGLMCLCCGMFISYNMDLIYKNGLTQQEYEIAKWLMILLSINLSISMPMSVFQQIIIAYERFIFLKLLAIIKSILTPLLTLPLLIIGYKSVSVVIVTVLISLFIDLFYGYYVVFKLKSKFIFNNFEKNLFKNIFIYTFFISLHVLTDQINSNVDKILLGRFRGTHDVSVYSVGYNFYSYFLMIGLAINGLFTPRVHTIVEQDLKNKDLLNKNLTSLFVNVGKIQFLAVALIESGFIFFGKQFIRYWAGEGYNDAYYVALLLMIPGTIDLIQNIGIEIQRAQNLHRFRAYVYIAMALINIIISIFLCQLYGAIGSAIGTAISLILVQGLIINLYYQKKCNINVIVFWKKILKMCLGLIIPIAFGIFINAFVKINSIFILLLLILAYSLIYFISMYLISLNVEEKALVKSSFKRVLKR